MKLVLVPGGELESQEVNDQKEVRNPRFMQLTLCAFSFFSGMEC